MEVMGADRNYIGVELSTDGDREAVIDAIEHDSRMHYETDHNGLLVFTGIDYSSPIGRLETAASHIDRLAYVHNHDSTGIDAGYYYENKDGTLVEVDAVGDCPAMDKWIFDHFAREYGIHSVF